MNDKDEKNFQETLKWFGAEREDEARFYFTQACEYKQKEINEMKKIIEYYANPENWDFEEIDQSDVEFVEETQANLGGKRARDFLLKLEGKCKIE